MTFRNDFLETLFKRKGGIKLGLGRISSAFPLILEKKIPVYHVTGTNGKGTAVYAVSHILQSNGFKTGRFISPHLYDYNERISVNGQNISDPEISDIYSFIEKRVPDFEELSFFEITFLMAWKHFEMTDCDRVVLEVGLGGRLDATNIIDWPKTDIITSIGLDHTHILGDTLEKIAFEKLGIIKNGDLVLLGRSKDDKFDRFLVSEAYLRGAKHVVNDLTCGSSLTETVDISEDQKRNFKLAFCAVNLTEKNIIIPDFSDLKLPGRFEEISPGIIIDVAHNPAAINSLVEYIKKKGMSVAFLYGAMKDKDIFRVTELLSAITEDIFIISLDAENRGASVKEITDRAGINTKSKLRSCENDEMTMKMAITHTRENGLKLIVTGSFHTIENFVRSDSYNDLVER
ncbi:MAG TPA: Mur ligase family protein [bacterium]|nr:Mur ligase family protein [bacterium]HPS30290.1 Mur ligase family protein [bacterium]